MGISKENVQLLIDAAKEMRDNPGLPLPSRPTMIMPPYLYHAITDYASAHDMSEHDVILLLEGGKLCCDKSTSTLKSRKEGD